MKILMCSSTYQGVTHGPAKFVHLIMRINDMYPEHEVRLLTRDIDEAIPNKIYKFERTYPPIIGAFWEYWDNRLFYRNILEIRKAYKFDTVIFVDAVLGFLTGKNLPQEIKTVGLVNDDEYINNDLSAIKPTKEWLIKFKSRWLERRAVHQMDLVIGNSDFLCKKLESQYELGKEKVKKLYKAIDISKFKYQADKQINIKEPIKIFFVKNDYQRGGLAVLAEALGLITDRTFIVNVAGPHDNQKRIVDGYFANKDHVSYNFLGKISQENVIDHLEEDDILCVPALREALGVANIEGLAKGTPVVSTTAGGIPEILGGGEFGWLANPDDAKSLAGQLRSCINSPAERNNRSELGRKHIEQGFSHEHMISSLIQLLDI